MSKILIIEKILLMLGAEEPLTNNPITYTAEGAATVRKLVEIVNALNDLGAIEVTGAEVEDFLDGIIIDS